MYKNYLCEIMRPPEFRGTGFNPALGGAENYRQLTVVNGIDACHIAAMLA